MAATHEASLRPNVRKPKKDWTRTPEEEAAYQRMQAKCAQRAHPKVDPAPPPEEAAVDAVPRLTWKRLSRYVMISGSQQFQVVKECVGNVSRGGVNYSNGRTVYQCWRRVEFLWYIKFEPYQETFEAAKAICEAYAKAHPFGQKHAADAA